ncbi:MAG: hypothetical protein H7X89_15945 [Rhizobiales bacterium]|nr:hypothetical protein [Hyphomicrobiales bacterium]
MLIHGFPFSLRLPEDLGFSERFWYWRGASGRNYIHSIYAAAACPPLPGAVYVAVRCEGGQRRAIATGRFPNFWDGSIDGLAHMLEGVEADEIHVHLLARNERDAEAVSDDLGQALGYGMPALAAA